MRTKRPWLSLMIGNVAALAATAVSAAGLGAGGTSAVLGQPLDFAVQLRLDPGESLGPDCVSAEVTAGERRLAPSLVRALVETTGADTARVRVLTQSGIDEPVIGVHLVIGCTVRISRRYVLLADPPNLALSPVAPAFAATPVEVPQAQGVAPLANQDAAPQVTAAREGASDQAVVPVPEQARPPRKRSDRRAAARATPRATARAKAPVRKTAVATAPRLQLEFVEPPRGGEAAAVEAALAAVAQAASAARAAASAASASAERMATLERSVEQLRNEAQSSRELAAQFKQRLAESTGASVWMLPLLVATGLLAALAAWLAWRLGRVQSSRQQGWRTAAELPEPSTVATPGRQATAPIPFVTSELAGASPVVAAANRPRAAPAWPPPAPPVAWPAPNSTLAPDVPTVPLGHPGAPDTDMQRTLPLPPGALPEAEAPRDVSIEELIDLEQQADFFVVLGQDAAAIELLTEHLRSTGGGSPLPYLKLLEIYHRRGEPEAYERVRARFNSRFNAYAPQWGVDLGHGRSLEDYPEAIPRLQQVWSRPLDAMAELEALLFRKSRGELFDLPAYREVLFLYSLARDLLDRAAGDSGDVDLFLPMTKAADFSSTAPSPYLGLQREAFRDTMPPDEANSSLIDLDLSAGERATSIFDLLDETPPPPRRT